jgi:hypothetical protein
MMMMITVCWRCRAKEEEEDYAEECWLCGEAFLNLGDAARPVEFENKATTNNSLSFLLWTVPTKAALIESAARLLSYPAPLHARAGLSISIPNLPHRWNLPPARAQCGGGAEPLEGKRRRRKQLEKHGNEFVDQHEQ